MRRAVATAALLLVILALGATSCSSARHHTPEAREVNFGVNMAQQNLWREALFRFQRAVDMKPGDAMAHNNLAVALEANGEFDKAAKEYREAMRLDKSNQYIQKNYSRFVEFTSRNKKRQQKSTAAAATKTVSTKPDTAAPPDTQTSSAPPAQPAEPPAASPQPTGTAPADVKPPTPAPPPAKPPGDQP